MTSTIRQLEDGSYVTDIVCEKCGTKSSITNMGTTWLHCICGLRHLNIAYYDMIPWREDPTKHILMYGRRHPLYAGDIQH